MLIFRKEAEEDIKNAYEWYEEKRSNLGESFMAELESIFGKISQWSSVICVAHCASAFLMQFISIIS